MGTGRQFRMRVFRKKKLFKNGDFEILTKPDLTNLTIHYPNPAGSTQRLSKYSFWNTRIRYCRFSSVFLVLMFKLCKINPKTVRMKEGCNKQALDNYINKFNKKMFYFAYRLKFPFDFQSFVYFAGRDLKIWRRKMFLKKNIKKSKPFFVEK